MGLLAGENATLLQGDIDNLKNDFERFKITHCSDHYEEANRLYPRINIIEERINFLQGFMDDLNDRILILEKFYTFYNIHNEKETNNFS
jgi:hypothetical protein